MKNFRNSLFLPLESIFSAVQFILDSKAFQDGNSEKNGCFSHKIGFLTDLNGFEGLDGRAQNRFRPWISTLSGIYMECPLESFITFSNVFLLVYWRKEGVLPITFDFPETILMTFFPLPKNDKWAPQLIRGFDINIPLKASWIYPFPAYLKYIFPNYRQNHLHFSLLTIDCIATQVYLTQFRVLLIITSASFCYSQILTFQGFNPILLSKNWKALESFSKLYEAF